MGVIQGTQRQFMTGNEVVAWAALAAGAQAMFGYPITPQNEIMHYWTRLAPEHGLRFLQTEDELSAGFATIGAALAGSLVFCATAGPGNVLMQEPISMAEMMRVPAVWVIQRRRPVNSYCHLLSTGDQAHVLWWQRRGPSDSLLNVFTPRSV